MPFALIVIGVVLLVSSVKNTTSNLFTLLKGDFTGSDNFLYWCVAIIVIGAVGYVPTFRGLSRLFLALVIVVLLITKGNPDGVGGGFFSQIQTQLFGSDSSNTAITTSNAAASTLQTTDIEPSQLIG